jgi:hypothetical protein
LIVSTIFKAEGISAVAAFKTMTMKEFDKARADLAKLLADYLPKAGSGIAQYAASFQVCLECSSLL